MALLSGILCSYLKRKPSLMSIRTLTTRNYKVVCAWGDKRPREKHILNHYEIIMQLGIGNTDEEDRSLYWLKLDGVKLHESLLAYGFQFLRKQGYKLWMSPIYEFTEPVDGDYPNPDIFPSAKHPEKVTEVGDESYTIAPAKCLSMPAIKYYGNGLCKRTNEDRSGQPMLDSPYFERVNQFAFTSPTESSAITQELINNSAILCQELLIPYQILYFSGSPSSLIKEKYKLQAWFPASESYVTVAYSSNLGEHNARFIKYGDKRIENVHFVNSTFMDIDRVLFSMLENYQTIESVA